MTFHGFFTPADMPDLSYWRDYICGQAVAASLGLIPVHALCMYVQFENKDRKLTLGYQLTEVTDEDMEDMEEIFDQFGEHTGGDLENPPFTISWTHEIVEKIHAGPRAEEIDWSKIRSVYVRNHRTLPRDGPEPQYAWISPRD